MVDFGKGPTLYDTFAWLRDDEVRHKWIIDVVERNSVIAGLPPFSPEMRLMLQQQLESMSGPETLPEPDETGAQSSIENSQ